MKYFGVPTCPYCKKRVNLIRTWSLKRQGEYRCPRCAGISNIYLSPLIYVFALLAVFAGGAVYFFHKFILDDISLSIVFQVIVPFAVFFLLSLFMVYLEKPVIKKVPKAELDKKRRKGQSMEERRMQPVSQPIQYDPNEYLPRGNYSAGPMPEPPTKLAEPKAPVPKAVPARDELGKTSVVPKVRNVSQPVRRMAGVQEPVYRESAPAANPTRTAVPQENGPAVPAAPQAAVRASAAVEQPQAAASRSTDDFFAKYDDPEYVERRLKELENREIR